MQDLYKLNLPILVHIPVHLKFLQKIDAES